MQSWTVQTAQSQFFQLIDKVNQEHLPIQITSHHGNAVLLSKHAWDSLQETLYLQAQPGFVKALQEVEQSQDWISEEEFWEILDNT